MVNMEDNNYIPKITLVSATVFVKWLTEGIRQIYDDLGKIFNFKIYFLNDVDSGKIPAEDFVSDIHESDIILLDIRGNCPTAELIVNEFNEMESSQPQLFKEKTIISLVGGNSEIRRLTKMGPFLARNIPSPGAKEYGIDEIPDMTDAVRFGQRMTKLMKFLGKLFPTKMLKHARYWAFMMDYWVYGLSGMAENHKNMILFLLKHYLGYKELDVQDPSKIPSHGIYDIEKNHYFPSLSDYFEVKKMQAEKQTIGLFFYGGLYFEQSLPIVEQVMEQFKEYNVIPVFSDVLTNLQAHQEFFFDNNRCMVSAIINLQYFQLNGGPFGGDGSVTLDLFRKMDVPHFNPIIQFDMPYDEYINSEEGILPINQIIAIVMPELDGRFEMITVGCMNKLGYSEEIHSQILEVMPLKENIQLVCSRVKKWLDLRIKLNSEKKIVLMIYNYPPGEDKIGNAAYLDVSESISILIDRLIKEGYKAKRIPDDKSITDLFLEGGSVNCPKFTSGDKFTGILLKKENYLDFFNALDKDLQEGIIKFWGEPIGDIMTINSHFKLPIIELGNVYLCLQPSRSKVSGDSNDYHDKNLPPHHQYLAFYRYIEKIIKADAIINMGTHGTEEFLPGKESAGYYKDYNLNLLGSLPNLYYYHITNTSESAIAKRRANALIINHAGPSFAHSNLYEELELLENLILNYQSENTTNLSKDENSIETQRIIELEEEIHNIATQLNLSYSSISELEDLLYRYKTSVIPMGLHVLGKNYTLEQKKDFICMILVHSAEIPPEINEIVELFGEDNNERSKGINEYLAKIYESESKINHLDEKSIKKLSKTLEGENQFNYLNRERHITLINWINKMDINMDSSSEMENIIHALEGGYIEPGLGGDPIRSPHIFPTGRNSYGFDPRLIPNSTAYIRGADIANKLLSEYKNDYGTWPSSVSVVLWAFETMKTGGETIGQIFNYLGVRAVKNKSIWTTELEVIPLEELGHPRINVLVTICGIFRDTFPYLLELINQAVDLVSNLEEPLEMNYIKKTMLELKEQKIKNPNARVFGPPPGKYNTNLTNIISAGKWKEEKELAQDYLNCMSYAYMKNRKVEKNIKNFSKNINKLDLMSQIRDSSEYHITDLDHYYEFTGGLAKTYQEISGKKANVFIADSSRKNIKIDTLGKSIKEGSITRSLNPRWIKGLLKHKYHGGQKVAERIENVLGLAATTHEVDNWIWDKTYDQYINNDEIREALIENNQFAMMDIIKNMLQADERGYWNANEDQLENLKRLYLNLENWVETNF